MNPGCVVRVLTLLVAVPLVGRAQQAPSPAPIDPTWLSYDRAARTVDLQLIAALTGANGGLNFNGFREGELTVVVPVGWTMHVAFANHDGQLPHSAEVIRAEFPLPLGPVDPAIPRAVTLHLEGGIPPHGRDDMRFVAEPAGEYLLFCAVPGHGAAGMWIRLRVSADAGEPTMLRTPRQ